MTIQWFHTLERLNLSTSNTDDPVGFAKLLVKTHRKDEKNEEDKALRKSY